ncbi:MAG: transposase [Actinobacteria bacterium]|nr:transposase [Actinomycetota bacterium]
MGGAFPPGWHLRAAYTEIEPLKKFAGMLKRRLAGILAHCRYPIHAGVLEGIDNRYPPCASGPATKASFPRSCTEPPPTFCSHTKKCPTPPAPPRKLSSGSLRGSFNP